MPALATRLIMQATDTAAGRGGRGAGQRSAGCCAWYDAWDGVLAPDTPVLKTAEGAIYAEPQPEQPIAADGWFSLLGLGFGLLVALVLWFVLRRRRGPVGLLAAVARRVGRRAGGLAGGTADRARRPSSGCWTTAPAGAGLQQARRTCGPAGSTGCSACCRCRTATCCCRRSGPRSRTPCWPAGRGGRGCARSPSRPSSVRARGAEPGRPADGGRAPRAAGGLAVEQFQLCPQPAGGIRGGQQVLPVVHGQRGGGGHRWDSTGGSSGSCSATSAASVRSSPGTPGSGQHPRRPSRSAPRRARPVGEVLDLGAQVWRSLGRRSAISNRRRPTVTMSNRPSASSVTWRTSAVQPTSYR